MRVLLVSTYELGRQPFGVASAAAWLKREGHEVQAVDTSRQSVGAETFAGFGLIAFHLPMHTATRLASSLIVEARRQNSRACLCCFGLYAPLNEPHLRQLGVQSILGGEFEAQLVRLASGGSSGDSISLERLKFIVPDRTPFPGLEHYAKLQIDGRQRLAGYTEASRGCKHRCRHCPVVNVYNGVFRVVQEEIVLADIRQQVETGATHITFGDPDFFNGPTHAIRILEALHQQFPGITYDATIKIEHLRKHASLLPTLRRTGCLFVTTAVESVDNAILARLEKGHTREDFLWVTGQFRHLDLTLSPTFIAFTPWTSRDGYRELLATIEDLDLIDHVSPVQLALRLLIPSRSRLLELPDLTLTGFDEAALLWRWQHVDPEVDSLAERALKTAATAGSRREVFARLRKLVDAKPWQTPLDLLARATIPFLDEPWYC